MPDGKSSDSEMLETSGEHGMKEDNYQYQNAGMNHTYDTPEPATIETSMEEKDVQADLKKLPPLKKFDPSNKSDQMTDLWWSKMKNCSFLCIFMYKCKMLVAQSYSVYQRKCLLLLVKFSRLQPSSSKRWLGVDCMSFDAIMLCCAAVLLVKSCIRVYKTFAEII